LADPTTKRGSTTSNEVGPRTPVKQNRTDAADSVPAIHPRYLIA
jgi:hypothetical protein